MTSLDTTVRAEKDAVEPSQHGASSVLWTRASVAALASLMAVATVLRFLFLVRKPFWFDECFSVEVARLRWSDFFRLLWRREANMSLYYLLLRGWLHFGSSPFFIRSLSVIFSLAALPAIYWLAGRLFDRRVALLSAALLSFHAYPIRYAQEARSYSLFVLLAILSSGFFVETVRERSRGSKIGYAITSVLAVYAHLYALLLLAAQWLSIRAWKNAGDELHARLRSAWIWIALASSPIVIFAAKTGAGPIRWIPKPRLHDLLKFAEQLAGNDGLFLLLIYVAACLTALVVLPGRHARDGASASPFESWQLRFLLLWLFFPILFVLALSLVRPLFLGRYFIFCLPPFVVLTAASIMQLRRAWLIVVAVIVLMTSAQNNQKLHYEGNAVAWQGANRVEADRLDIDRGRHILEAHGKVVSQFIDKAKGDDSKDKAKGDGDKDKAKGDGDKDKAKSEPAKGTAAKTSTAQVSASTKNLPLKTVADDRGKEIISKDVANKNIDAGIDSPAKSTDGKAKSSKAAVGPVYTVVRAPDLIYDEDSRIANYQGGATLARPGLNVVGRAIRAFLRDSDSDSSLDKAFADGEVKIVHTDGPRTRVGTSEHAEYYADDEKVLLNGGSPLLVDSLKGKTSGHELTWFAHNDRLLVNGIESRPADSLLRKK